MDRTVWPGRVSGTLTPPASKSHAQRALAAALLAEGESEVSGLTWCDDTRAALRCIRALGARIKAQGGERPVVESFASPTGAAPEPDTLFIRGGLSPRGDVLHVGESGLATRLFTPIAALSRHPVRIEGEGTLRHRPMGAMAEALRTLGASVRDTDGHLPLSVEGPLRGGVATIDGALSSQFTTGLLTALPMAADDTTLHVAGAVSTPYLDMTLAVVRHFGVEIAHNDYTEFYIAGGQRYRPARIAIEGDWSAAAMLLVAGATAGEVTVDNLPALSPQADTAVLTALVRAGAAVVSQELSASAARQPLTAFEFDATQCPDLFPALVALAASAEGVSVVKGTSRLPYKECHRGEVLREEFGRLGIEIDTSDDDLMRIRGGRIRAGRVSSPHDHRIAMALAVAALRAEGPVAIEGAECVTKSYPAFFDDLEKIRCR